MEKNWVCIFSSSFQQSSELTKELLSFNNIQSIIINKQDSFYKFGEYEVYVNRDNVVRAKFFLSQVKNESDPSNS